MAPAASQEKSSPTGGCKPTRGPTTAKTATSPQNGSPSSSPTQTRSRGIRFGLGPRSSPPMGAVTKVASPPLSEPTSASSPSSFAIASPVSSTTTSPPLAPLNSPPLYLNDASPPLRATGAASKLAASSKVPRWQTPQLQHQRRSSTSDVVSVSTSPPDSPPKRGSLSGESESPTPYHISEIDSGTAHRAIRTIVHSGFSKIQEEAEDEPFGPGVPKMRTYFVAADLSSEGAHAIEWTIGAFLRDGDTLLVIHAVDSSEPEVGKVGTALGGTGSRTASREGTPTGGIPIGSGGAAVSDTQDAIRKLNRRRSSARRRAGSLPGRARSSSDSATAPIKGGSNGGGGGADGGGSGGMTRFSRSPSVDSSGARPQPRTWMETARLKSIVTITAICARALAKRDVKVQIAIEVIHCRSPKHMITEAIDTLEPTLVILGSRGRSALKGVLLGSFSNYLVTKSSVPVIVARRRHTIKPPQHLSKDAPRPQLRALPTNRVDSPNRLVTARID